MLPHTAPQSPIRPGRHSLLHHSLPQPADLRHKLVALFQERESQKHVPSMVRTLDFEGTEGLQEAITITTIDAIARPAFLASPPCPNLQISLARG